MRNLFLKIKNLLRRARRKKTGSEAAETMREKARKDWLRLVVVFIILAILTIAANYFVFVGIENDVMGIGNPPSATSEDSIDQKKLTEVVGLINGRAQTFGDIAKKPVDVADPSR